MVIEREANESSHHDKQHCITHLYSAQFPLILSKRDSAIQAQSGTNLENSQVSVSSPGLRMWPNAV